MTKRTLTAEDIDRMVDNGEDITPYIDMSSVEQPGKPASRRLSLDIPEPQVARLDAAAARIGVPRKALINLACEEWLNREEERQARLAALG